jgi:TrmH family RNA methyltransferase
LFVKATMITSAQNSKIKQVRALLTQSKARRREGRLVLEGSRLIGDVLAQGFQPDYALHRPDLQSDVLDALHKADVECIPVEANIFESLSDTENSQGLLAVCAMPELLISPDASLLMALDGLQDPGNLGSILRAAAAADADGVLLLPGTVGPFNPKVVRAGMGAHFRMPVVAIDWGEFAEVFNPDWHIVVADAAHSEARPYWDALPQSPTVIVMGNEAHGISEDAKRLASGSIFIPMARGVESLNTATAAAILLFEFRRQRQP